ncbi:MAG: 6-bladed beta-propeller [Duncaniella sp.]|nr:6-bladed beta-propeller [Duncaniella sp.]
MKITLKSYFLIIFALLASCSKSISEKSEDILTIDLTQELTSTTPIVVREISLSTGDDDPIGHISKFVPTKDGFFIMDAFRNIVWKFSETGEIQGKLHNIGNGPGEYSSVGEIDVYPNGDLAILDFKTNKIHRYDGLLKFVSSVEIPGKAINFTIGDSASYFLSKAGDKHEININLGHFNTSDGAIEPILKSKHKYENLAFGSGATHFWRSDDDVIFYNRFTPDFYLIRNDSVSPYFSISSDNIPDNDVVATLIKATMDHQYSCTGIDSATILDVSYAFKCGDILLLGLSSTPQQHICYRFSDNQMFSLNMNTPSFYGALQGAIGVYQGCFVTNKQPLDDGNPSILLYKFNN